MKELHRLKNMKVTIEITQLTYAAEFQKYTLPVIYTAEIQKLIQIVFFFSCALLKNKCKRLATPA